MGARAGRSGTTTPTRFAAAGEPQVAVGRARALFRLDRVDEAVDGARRRCSRASPTMSRRCANARRSRWSSARPRARASSRPADRDASPTGRGRNGGRRWRARSTISRDYDARRRGARRAGAAVSRNSPLAERERLRLAKERERGHDDLSVMIEAALRRFPGRFRPALALGRGSCSASAGSTRPSATSRRSKPRTAPGYRADGAAAAGGRPRRRNHLRAYRRRARRGARLERRRRDPDRPTRCSKRARRGRSSWRSAILEGVAARIPAMSRLDYMRIRLMIARRAGRRRAGADRRDSARATSAASCWSCAPGRDAQRRRHERGQGAVATGDRDQLLRRRRLPDRQADARSRPTTARRPTAASRPMSCSATRRRRFRAFSRIIAGSASGASCSSITCRPTTAARWRCASPT